MVSPIHVNGRALGRNVTGVERYATEIVKQLNDKIQIAQPRSVSSGIKGHVWEQVVLPTSISKGALLWAPANTGPLHVANQVLTLHDVSVLEHPEWFNPSFSAWYRFLLPRLAKRVRKIITVSEFSKVRIVEVLGVSEEKVVVIPNGVDHELFYPRDVSEIREVKTKYGIKKDYAITVGSLQPRKNFSRLFAAWQQVSPKFPHIELLVVGVEAAVYRSRGYVNVPPNVRFLGRVPDSDLAMLYSGAFACVQPSLYEGFNLPVLEAMACGIPVLAANTTATTEIIGDAGLLCDPLSVEGMREAISLVLNDHELRTNLREKGLMQASQYCWEESASTTWGILKTFR